MLSTEVILLVETLGNLWSTVAKPMWQGLNDTRVECLHLEVAVFTTVLREYMLPLEYLLCAVLLCFHTGEE